MKHEKAPFILLAPMEGVIDAVMRELYSHIGGYDRMVCEFIRVTDQLLPKQVFFRYCPELLTGGKTSQGVPVYVQLLGGKPQWLAENAAFAVQLGAPGIDLNFGCPAPTVNRHDGGATLLKNPDRLYNIISAVREKIPANIPVTAKVRLGFEHKDFVKEIAEAVDSAGAETLTIHARTRNEGYKPPAHWEYIRIMKSHVKNAHIIANGEIWSKSDYLLCQEITGCNDVALGRGAIACPDLALQIKAQHQYSSFEPWTWEQIQKDIFKQFIEKTLAYRGEPYTIGRTKQWLRQLSRSYSPAQFKFNQIKTFSSLKQIRQEMNC